MQSPPLDGVLVDRANVSAEPSSPATSAGPVDSANYCAPHVHDGPRITWTNMTVDRLRKLLTPHAQAADPTSLNRQVGGGDGLLPVWITGPNLEFASGVTGAIDVAIDRLHRAIEGIGS